MKYIIAFDLVNPEPEDSYIVEALKNMGAEKVFPTVWIHKERSILDNTDKLRNHLRDFLSNRLDQLLVVRLASKSQIKPVERVGAG